MRQKSGKFWRTIDFPGVSEFNREPEEPLQGAKMTVMDILEFTDINGPAPKIWTNKGKLVPAGRFAPPPFLGLTKKNSVTKILHLNSLDPLAKRKVKF